MPPEGPFDSSKRCLGGRLAGGHVGWFSGAADIDMGRAGGLAGEGRGNAMQQCVCGKQPCSLRPRTNTKVLGRWDSVQADFGNFGLSPS
jgi:hypothetical protein